MPIENAVYSALPAEVLKAEITPEELQAIVEATKVFFPGEINVASEWDPEYPRETYTVLHVSATGDVKSIVDRHCRWVDMLGRLAPRLRGKVRLSIDPRA